MEDRIVFSTLNHLSNKTNPQYKHARTSYNLINPLHVPLIDAILRTYTPFKKYEFLEGLFSLNKISMHLLHAKYTDEWQTA